MTTSENMESQVSAFVDGEIDQAEVSLLSKRMANDPKLQQQWHDYHLISDAIKKQLPEQVDTGFAARISEAIDQEPEFTTTKATPLPVKKHLSGFAIAASVAAMAVLGVINIAQQDPSGNGQMLAKSESVQAQNIAVAQLPVSTSYVPVSSVQRHDPRLNKYLVNHSEYAVSASVRGVLPYARVVGQHQVRK